MVIVTVNYLLKLLLRLNQIIILLIAKIAVVFYTGMRLVFRSAGWLPRNEEKSPDSIGQKCLLTGGFRKKTESATESKPPLNGKGETVV